jgi:hypothetical protein
VLLDAPKLASHSGDELVEYRGWIPDSDDEATR